MGSVVDTIHLLHCPLDLCTLDNAFFWRSQSDQKPQKVSHDTMLNYTLTITESLATYTPQYPMGGILGVTGFTGLGVPKHAEKLWP